MNACRGNMRKAFLPYAIRMKSNVFYIKSISDAMYHSCVHVCQLFVKVRMVRWENGMEIGMRGGLSR